MAGVVAGAAAAIAGGAAAFIASGTQMAANLEEQMSGVQAVMGATADQMAQLEDLILDLGVDPNLKVNTMEAAAALESLGRNGLTVEEILEGAARATVLLANATGGEFAESADVATSVMDLWGITAGDMERAVDGITATVNNSRLEFSDYAMALAQGGGVAAQAGVSFEDFNTAIAAISPSFASGSDAGTSFKAMIQRLIPQSEEAEDTMRRLGLITADGSNAFFDAQGNMKSMAEIAGILNQALYGTTTVMTEVGGRTADQNAELERLRDMYGRTAQSLSDYEAGIKGAGMSEDARARKLEELRQQLANIQAAMDPLLGIQGDLVESTRTLTEEERLAAMTIIFGADAVRAASKLAEVGSEEFLELAASMSEVSAAEIAAIRMDNFKGSVEILLGVLDTIKIRVGDVFLRFLRPVVDGATEFLSNNSDRIVAAFDRVAGFLEKNIPRAIAIASDFWTNTLRPALVKTWSYVQANVIPIIIMLWGWLREQLPKAIQFLRDHWEELKGAVLAVGGFLALSSIFSTIAAVITALSSPITLIIGAVALLGAAWAKNWFHIRDVAADVWELLKQGFQGLKLLFSGDWEGFLAQVEGVWKFGLERVVFWFGQLWGWIQPKLIAFATGIINWFNSMDWGLLGRRVLEYIGTVLATFWSFVQPIVEGWWSFLSAWWEGIDWAKLGQKLVMAISGRLTELWSYAQPIIAGWWTSLQAWWEGIDWGVLGQKVVAAINAWLAQFWSYTQPIVAGWWTSLQTWWEGVDWASLAQKALDKIIGGFANFWLQAATTYAGWWLEIFNWFDTQDWTSLAFMAVERIVQELANFWLQAAVIVAGWWTSLQTWFEEKDWKTLGYKVVMRILEAFEEWWTNVSETVGGWWTSLQTWFEERDWKTLGYKVVTRILEAFEEWWTNVSETVNGWHTSLQTWFGEQDWKQLGHDTVLGILNGLANFWDSAVETIDGWYSAFEFWFEDQDWEAMGDTVNKKIDEGLKLFWETVKSTVAGWWTALKTWSENIDWGQVAQDIIDGIVNVLQTTTAVRDAIVGMAQGAWDALVEFWETRSPSRRTMELAHNIVDGLVEGVQARTASAVATMTDFGQQLGDALAEAVTAGAENAQAIMTGLLDTAGQLGSIGSVFGNIFKARTVDPLERQVKGLENQIKDLAKNELRDAMKRLGADNWQDLLGVAAITPNALTNKELRALEQLLALDEQRAAAAADYAAEYERLVALQTQQENLRLLEAQQDLLDLISENGLNAADILQGLELGLGADLGALLDAMARAMQQVIAQAEESLGIASPSRIFKAIGQQIDRGLALGIGSLGLTEDSVDRLLGNAIPSPAALASSTMFDQRTAIYGGLHQYSVAKEDNLLRTMQRMRKRR